MQNKELQEFIETVVGLKSESNHIEVKKAATGCPKILDTLSSFSNQREGGIILFGIDESDDFKVCGVFGDALCTDKGGSSIVLRRWRRNG